MAATGMAPPPDDMRMWDDRAAINAYTDLRLLTTAIDKLASEMIEHLDGGPGGGYGPRIYLAYWRKKAVLRMARKLRSEAKLIGSTAMRTTATRKTEIHMHGDVSPSFEDSLAKSRMPTSDPR